MRHPNPPLPGVRARTPSHLLANPARHLATGPPASGAGPGRRLHTPVRGGRREPGRRLNTRVSSRATRTRRSRRRPGEDAEPAPRDRARSLGTLAPPRAREGNAEPGDARAPSLWAGLGRLPRGLLPAGPYLGAAETMGQPTASSASEVTSTPSAKLHPMTAFSLRKRVGRAALRAHVGRAGRRCLQGLFLPECLPSIFRRGIGKV